MPFSAETFRVISTVYVLVVFNSEAGKSGEVVDVDQSKTFDRVDYWPGP